MNPSTELRTKPLRALIWKEGREAIYKIAIGVCLGLFIGLTINLDSDPDPDAFNFTFEQISFLVGLCSAVLMGMDVMAGERRRGTLPFLLSRPLRLDLLLSVKFAVRAAGLLVVLAAYWAGVYLGMPGWGDPNFLWGFFGSGYYASDYIGAILTDVGYVRMVLLWFFPFLILYTAVFLASAFSDRSAEAVIIGLMTVWVGLICLTLLSFEPVSYYLMLVFHTVLERDAKILRQAFEPSLLLARVAGAVLLAGGVLVWVCRAFRAQANRRFQWTVGALALISGGVVMWLNVTQSQGAEEPTEPVGRLPYEVPVVDLALKDRLAVVLLERGVSVVDVADWRVPKESGRVEIEGWQLWRLALSGSTAYIWGSSAARDSVGVAVFDLSQPERPQLRAQRLLYPIERGPTPWLKHTPRLVGWAAWDGYLYAGLLGNESLELHSFDVREGGLPQPVHVLPIAERTKHVWNNNWEMRLAGRHAFLTLGHDFVVLDLTDPRRPEELSRTPLRRFGRSKQYEQSIAELHRQLVPGVLPDSVAQKLERAGPRLEVFQMRHQTPAGESFYRIAAPPALGPISLSGDKAYIQRYWPEELAVLDIADLRRPVEVDYVPNESFASGLTMDGDFAYGLEWNGIGAYAVAEYGALWKRETLGLAEEDESRRIPGIMSAIADTSIISYTDRQIVQVIDIPRRYKMRHAPILAGDHICAILRNNLVVFEALKDD